MAFDAHKNFAVSTVATAPSPATSGTSLVVASGEGTRFPATPFNAVVWPAGVNPTPANAEVIRVTTISTDTFSPITRAQESSTARSIIVGDQIADASTAKTLTDIEGKFPIVSADITDGTIVNADISSSAAITGSRLATGASGPPGAEIEYTEKTSDTSITANTVAGANTIVTGGSVAYDGATAVLIEFYIARIDMANSTTPHLYIALFEDGTHLGVIADITSPAATSYSWPVRVVRKMTPSNASHTYSVRGYHNTGSFTSTAKAASGGSSSGNLMPAFLRITKA